MFYCGKGDFNLDPLFKFPNFSNSTQRWIKWDLVLINQEALIFNILIESIHIFLHCIENKMIRCKKEQKLMYSIENIISMHFQEGLAVHSSCVLIIYSSAHRCKTGWVFWTKNWRSNHKIQCYGILAKINELFANSCKKEKHFLLLVKQTKSRKSKQLSR